MKVLIGMLYFQILGKTYTNLGMPRFHLVRKCGLCGQRLNMESPVVAITDFRAATILIFFFIQRIFTTPAFQRLPLLGDPLAFEVGNFQEREGEVR